VVDDNVDAADTLAMLLDTTGHTAMVEHDAYGALVRARAEMPDVCLLDIGLPDMDGNTLARELRNLVETRDAVLVAVTGYGQQRDRESTHAAGFDYHLVKPVDTAQLMEILDTAAATRAR
jgi:CheY-like chemotaxis protein